MVFLGMGTPGVPGRGLSIPEKGCNQGWEVSWRRDSSGGHGTPQTRVTAGNCGDPGGGPRTEGIQERVMTGDPRNPGEGAQLGTSGVLEKEHK